MHNSSLSGIKIPIQKWWQNREQVNTKREMLWILDHPVPMDGSRKMHRDLVSRIIHQNRGIILQPAIKACSGEVTSPLQYFNDLI